MRLTTLVGLFGLCVGTLLIASLILWSPNDTRAPEITPAKSYAVLAEAPPEISQTPLSAFLRVRGTRFHIVSAHFGPANADLAQIMWLDVEHYAKRHGYSFSTLLFERLLYPPRDFTWLKVSALAWFLHKDPHARMPHYVWLDSDALIRRPEIPLEVVAKGVRNKTILSAAEGKEGLNAGFLVVRNHPGSLAFLDQLWMSGALLGLNKKNRHEQTTLQTMMASHPLWLSQVEKVWNVTFGGHNKTLIMNNWGCWFSHQSAGHNLPFVCHVTSGRRDKREGAAAMLRAIVADNWTALFAERAKPLIDKYVSQFWTDENPWCMSPEDAWIEKKGLRGLKGVMSALNSSSIRLGQGGLEDILLRTMHFYTCTFGNQTLSRKELLGAMSGKRRFGATSQCVLDRLRMMNKCRWRVNVTKAEWNDYTSISSCVMGNVSLGISWLSNTMRRSHRIAVIPLPHSLSTKVKDGISFAAGDQAEQYGCKAESPVSRDERTVFALVRGVAYAKFLRVRRKMNVTVD